MTPAYLAAPDRAAAEAPTEFDNPELNSFLSVQTVGRAEAVELINWGSRPMGRDIYPVDAPGLPGPGSDLLRLAQSLGSTAVYGELPVPEVEAEEAVDAGQKAKGKRKKKVKAEIGLLGADDILASLYQELLYANGNVHLPITAERNLVKRLAVVGGHVVNESIPHGPRRSTVMVIGKNIGEEEKRLGRNFVGPTSDLLWETCDQLGISGYGDWYVTNLIKTEHPLADRGETRLKTAWIREWLPLLHQELRLVQPRYILCLGADVADAMLSKAYRPPLVTCLDRHGKDILGGSKKVSVRGMEGRVVEYQFPITRNPGSALQLHRSMLMVATHPAAVLHAPEQQDVFENGLGRFGQLLRGLRPDEEEDGLDHREVSTLDELIALHDEISRTCEDNLIAVDAEWHGNHPQNAGSYLRTIQLSWKHKAAACIHVTHPGGTWRFGGSREDLCKWVLAICRGRRIAGQFLNADLEWLIPFGIDLRPWFAVADNWVDCQEQAVRRPRPRGGFDTGIAAHSINETGRFDLTSLALQFTTAPRYDIELDRWAVGFCQQNKLKREELEGFGHCPDDILVKYANMDADVTRRLVRPLQRLLSRDRFGNNSWEAFWTSMRALPGALEMSRTGLLIDRDRMQLLTDRYLEARTGLEAKLRAWAKWPNFNMNSVQEVREFLFGERLNGKKSEDGKAVRLRPEGAVSLRLDPVLSTSKRAEPWSEVREKGLEELRTPSTNKQSLSLLAQDNQAVMRWSRRLKKQVAYDFSQQLTWFRDWRFISQVLKSVLRTPRIDKETQGFVTDDDGNYEYSGGLPAAICDDGRVRTHFYLTKETGRWSSARPPLHNLGKRREVDYRRILGPRYTYAIRSILRAPPGYLLVDTDLAGAELAGVAFLSGDEKMIADVLANKDIHSHVAVLAFRLDCEPSKKGLQGLLNPKNPDDPKGRLYLRDLAKSVVFGVLYGRGAKAIALASKEEGIFVTVEEAQQVIDTLFQMYPGLARFFERCRERVHSERWICGAYGRYRRFPITRERAKLGDLERQAMNFPVQNLVADHIDRAVDNLTQYRREHPDIQYRQVFQLHDALMLLVPYAHVPRVIDEVIPECLSRRLPIYPTGLDGMPTGLGPYFLQYESEPHVWWGEQMTPDQHLAFGVPARYSGWSEQGGGYVHKSYPGQIWVGDATGGQLQAV